MFAAGIVFAVLVVAVLILGFFAARWRGGDLSQLHEWGLGGRQFGTLISWFLIGGDLYTAYTFIAVPALMFGAGAIAFFAVPYTIVAYPILYVVFPKMWRVAAKYGFVTGPEFVRGRYGNRWLALAVGVTGIIATMPYIALQLVGMQVVIGAFNLGIGFGGHLPLILAFLVLAAFTYTSGLRAPAMIAVVKDTLIYLTIIVAIIAIPSSLGGFGGVFAKIAHAKLLLPIPGPHTTGVYSGYATLALGSAMALFLYPHALTGILSARSSETVRKNAVILPAYSLMLGLITLLGAMAIAAGVAALPQFAAGFKTYGPSFAVPALLIHTLPGWFVGVAFAAIAIGALVPAAIMAIASANIFTRDIWKEFVAPGMSPSAESQIAKLFSIVMVIGALIFIFGLPQKYAIQLQLLGGMWMIQIFPSIVFSLFTRFYNGWALLVGWAVGIGLATHFALLNHLKGSIYPFHIGGVTFPCYIALATFVVNVLLATVLSPVFHAIKSDRTRDVTSSADYA
ncbi:MAG TPA: sodium:solute symporter [Acidiphilium sp.]|jgi:SSS family solute:Na+ symporter|uniref:monocarboxylate uptake permease MctP n=1 Tax=unclassified Acidiphilium TaxID=2617493 RepID=UPI000BD13D67|nr:MULTISPECIES: sodium:solute symporter [unclassified Acidiphilium]OYV56672.1 MAG: sodium:solute symporter [Acidiphilium sp. 20-67-58]HQT60887.1 sodium:solute symporter [Acidiphilium sp.]HQU10093.1 sodium:solute symporter [Acidiphilium sp.]